MRITTLQKVFENWTKIKIVYLTALMKIRTTLPWSTANDNEIKTTGEYKNIDLKMLIVYIETTFNNYFQIKCSVLVQFACFGSLIGVDFLENHG